MMTVYMLPYNDNTVDNGDEHNNDAIMKLYDIAMYIFVALGVW